MLPGAWVSDRLAETKGRTRGFDYLRAILSIAVIAFHSALTCYGAGTETQVWHGPWRPLLAFILPSFFALSGFLVAGSLVRTRTLHEFLTLRAVRLVPALFFEVLISAMLVGPLLTTVPLAEYFSAPAFRAYWLNIAGDIHYYLPGLFLTNPAPGTVNDQLWTIPIELRCYIAITVASILGITRHRWRILPIIAASTIAMPVAELLERGTTLTDFNAVSSKVLYLCFLAGIAIYLYQDRVRLSPWLLAGSIVAAWVLLPLPTGQYLAAVPVAYVTIYIGLLDPPVSLLSRIGTYSYGLYIYGFVTQQAYAYVFPSYRIWWLNILFSLSVAMVFAALSWHCLEQPVLRRRARAVTAVNALVEQVVLLWPRRRAMR
jgi:peptidoglycan/LPS O-acetylase OafA/YrhL